MNLQESLIIIIPIAVVVLCYYLLKPSTLTITINVDEGFPLKDDGVEELEVVEKPKRKYTKKAPITKINTVAKKPVGRPKKSK